ncbi:hypothetical protein D3C85_1234390 [compost metagenome]
MQAARPFTAATAEEQVNVFVTAAGRREVTGHRPQGAEGQAGFFFGFAVGDFLGLLVLVDQPGHHLDQPGVVDLVQCTNAELLDQHHFIAQRVVRQHAHRIMAHEQFAADLAAHAPGKQLVAQA